MSGRPKLVVMGRICHDAVGGAVWHFLHYVLGFERLGFEVYYVEWTDKWVADPHRPTADTDFPRVMVGDVFARWGLDNRWLCRTIRQEGEVIFGGFSAARLPELYREAVAIVNVSGTHHMNDDQLLCDRRIYLETDPGIPQIRLANGDDTTIRLVEGHTHLVTFGANIGRDDCLLPETGYQFGVTRPAVILDEWKTLDGPGRRMTTITKWEKKAKEVVLDGTVYRWSKRDEFLRFVDLPDRSPIPLELAVAGASDGDVATLRRHGWSVLDGLSVSSSLDRYRSYITESSGEFTIAKDQYVRLRTGWFSDRSACYLAAGRPVVTQDTGFGRDLPTGRGLFAFNSEDEILAAFDAIASDPVGESAAAREIGREYFDSDRLLADLLQQAGVGTPLIHG